MNKFSKQKLNKRNKQKYTQANEPISATFDIIIVKQELLTNILINYMKTTATCPMLVLVVYGSLCVKVSVLIVRTTFYLSLCQTRF